MADYPLKYKTFNQLLSEIEVDFKNYSLENMIEPQQLIKVAKRVNYDLGLRIMKTKEQVLDVDKHRVRLPDDFYVLNFALLCDHRVEHVAMPQGTNIQEIKITPEYKPAPFNSDLCSPATVNCTKCNQVTCSCNPISCADSTSTQSNPFGDPCIKPRVFLNCKNECFELVQIINTVQHTYSRLLPLKIRQSSQNIDCECPNVHWRCVNEAWISDGFLHTNFAHGKVYINYEGTLENDQGELLVPDHDLLNEYYEYALKSRILENLVMNDEPVGKRLELVETRLRAARNNALSVVNMPNFSEMKSLWEANRKAQYSKYYAMFRSYSWDLPYTTDSFTKANRY